MPEVQDRSLHYECFSGISGDMHLGAMHALGVPEAGLRACLSRLAAAGAFDLSFAPARRRGLSGTLATVRCHEPARRPVHGLAAVQQLLAAAELPAPVTARALDIFTRLAEAEAAVHGVGVNDIHFHEVGALDALVDIVGAAFALDWLAPQHVYCDAVELGSGTVRCEHGLLPVPAPATEHLLRGRPVSRGRIDGEATTPTGAAILAHAVTDWTLPPAPYRAVAVAYGCGQKEFAVPNLLRVSQIEPAAAVATDRAAPETLTPLPDFGYDTRSDIELVCTLDDMTPEALGRLQQALWTLPVFDVTLTATLMKKQRPAQRLAVLIDPAQLKATLDCLFAHSSSLGVRAHRVNRWVLSRTEQPVTTRFGPVRVKIATHPNGQRRYKIEHDDLAQLLATAREPWARERAIRAEIDAWFNQLPQPGDTQGD